MNGSARRGLSADNSNISGEENPVREGRRFVARDEAKEGGECGDRLFGCMPNTRSLPRNGMRTGCGGEPSCNASLLQCCLEHKHKYKYHNRNRII